MPHQHQLVADIKTIPDADHHDGDAFPNFPYLQVMAISFLEAEIESDEGDEIHKLRELGRGMVSLLSADHGTLRRALRQSTGTADG